MLKIEYIKRDDFFRIDGSLRNTICRQDKHTQNAIIEALIKSNAELQSQDRKGSSHARLVVDVQISGHSQLEIPPPCLALLVAQDQLA